MLMSPPIPCRSAIPRKKKDQRTKNTMTGSTHDSSEVSQLLSVAPVTLTPAFSKIAANSGSTRLAIKYFLPFWGSLNSPSTRVSVSVTEAIRPCSAIWIISL